MKRLEKFESYATHDWLKKAFGKMKAPELEMARRFIRENDHLSKGDFELKVNRMFLDLEKPKNWTIILELLTCANSSL